VDWQDQTPVRVLGGFADAGHAEPRAERVPRAHRLEPAQLVDAARPHARHVVDEAAHEQSHEERGGVPAAGDQPAVDRLFGRFNAGMERLRVEPARELEDLLLADDLLAQLEHLTFAEVLQIAGHARHSTPGADHRPIS